MPSSFRPASFLAGSLLMTELSLTRIFSVTMYDHFAFMAISIALFGLSASSYIFLMHDRWKDVPTEPRSPHTPRRVGVGHERRALSDWLDAVDI